MKVFMRKLPVNNGLFCLLAVLTVVFLPAGLAHAQTTEDPLDRLFTIQAVKVDETASRASQARETALEKAEHIAYATLMRKLTQPEGRDRLPTLTRVEIQSMISGIEVVSEQSSSRRYLATLNIRFEPGLVSQFLARYDVPHVLGTGRGILVLHAHARAFNGLLWERDGVLNEARAKVDWVNRIRQYVFPVGTMAERVAVTYEEVAAFDADDAKALARNYDVSSVMMLRSEWRNGTLRYGYSSTDDGMTETGMTITAQDESQAVMMMYDAVLDRIDSAWRAQLLVDTGVGGEMEVLVPTTGIASFNRVMAQLEEVSLINSRKTLEIGLPVSRVWFKYTGREDQLRLALRYAGLNLEEYGRSRMLAVREGENQD